MNARRGKPDGDLGWSSLERLLDARNDFADSDRPMKNRGNRLESHALEARRDDDYGHSPCNLLHGRACGSGFENNCRRHLARGDGAPRIVRRFHPQGIDSEFTQFRAHGGAQRPILRDHENGWHLVAGV